MDFYKETDRLSEWIDKNVSGNLHFDFIDRILKNLKIDIPDDIIEEWAKYNEFVSGEDYNNKVNDLESKISDKDDKIEYLESEIEELKNKLDKKDENK